MKKLIAALIISTFTFGTLAVAATPNMKQDTTKKHNKMKRDTMKKDTAKKPRK